MGCGASSKEKYAVLHSGPADTADSGRSTPQHVRIASSKDLEGELVVLPALKASGPPPPLPEIPVAGPGGPELQLPVEFFLEEGDEDSILAEDKLAAGLPPLPAKTKAAGGAGAEKTANSELPRATAVSAQLDLEPVVRPRSFRRRV
mmetsp:Transcript_110523/g.155133  ORF Transcript_110523/g.155133 Transcript_110523/m.155133 type:complete len:147 (+) Transcript_110523:29-469(+)